MSRLSPWTGLYDVPAADVVALHLFQQVAGRQGQAELLALGTGKLQRQPPGEPQAVFLNVEQGVRHGRQGVIDLALRHFRPPLDRQRPSRPKVVRIVSSGFSLR